MIKQRKRIAIVTATRAEYGLLKPIINKFLLVEYIETDVIVTGTHLEKEFGNTVREIEQDNIPIAYRISILSKAVGAVGVSETMANALIHFSALFSEVNYNLIIILGDRYESLAIASAAFNANIPIAHLYGGDTTEGAADEAYRHAITKMSFLHFTSTEDSRRRVIQLGENPDRVFTVGSIGIENIIQQELLSEEQFRNKYKISSRPYALVTFHPVTLERETSLTQIKELLDALSEYQDMDFIITKANADSGGKEINIFTEEYSKDKDNFYLMDSLGTVGYLSGIKYARMVIGNSSSGLTEVPSFGIPTVNVGDRQKGRLQGDSIINCRTQKNAIVNSIRMALTDEWIQRASVSLNPYGDGNTSSKIVSTIVHILEKPIELKKVFFDII